MRRLITKLRCRLWFEYHMLRWQIWLGWHEFWRIPFRTPSPGRAFHQFPKWWPND